MTHRVTNEDDGLSLGFGLGDCQKQIHAFAPLEPTKSRIWQEVASHGWNGNGRSAALRSVSGPKLPVSPFKLCRAALAEVATSCQWSEAGWNRHMSSCCLKRQRGHRRFRWHRKLCFHGYPRCEDHRLKGRAAFNPIASCGSARSVASATLSGTFAVFGVPMSLRFSEALYLLSR